MVYRASPIRGLAITQMVIGALMIVLAIASIFAVHHWSSYVGFGIWIGLWVLISGILGYIGARSDTIPNKCLLGTFMAFAIVSCVLTVIMVICYSSALSSFSARVRARHYYYHYNYDDHYGLDYDSAKNGIGLGVCLLILALTEFFIALASSIYCCNTTCCDTTVNSTQQVVYLPPQPVVYGQSGGVVVVNPTGPATSVQTIHTTHPGMIVQGQPTYAMGNMPGNQVVQPAYWAAPSGAAGGPPMNAAGVQPYQPYPAKIAEMPPPYEPDRPM